MHFESSQKFLPFFLPFFKKPHMPSWITLMRQHRCSMTSMFYIHAKCFIQKERSETRTLHLGQNMVKSEVACVPTGNLFQSWTTPKSTSWVLTKTILVDTMKEEVFPYNKPKSIKLTRPWQDYHKLRNVEKVLPGLNPANLHSMSSSIKIIGVIHVEKVFAGSVPSVIWELVYDPVG